jgi:hypothetical protein
MVSASLARIASTFALAGLVVACSSSSSPNTGTNVGNLGTDGVDDVVKACQIRAGWVHINTSLCGECTGLTTAPRCSCSHDDFAGACNTRQAAFTNEPTCDGVVECVYNCKQGDCACVDACYVGKDKCRPLGAALDGCVAEQCADSCQ